ECIDTVLELPKLAAVEEADARLEHFSGLTLRLGELADKLAGCAGVLADELRGLLELPRSGRGELLGVGELFEVLASLIERLFGISEPPAHIVEAERPVGL